MKSPKFQSDRSDALRRQLVDLPARLPSRDLAEQDLPAREPDTGQRPSRRVLLALGAAGVGGIVVYGATRLAGRQKGRPEEQAQQAAPTNSTARPTGAAQPSGTVPSPGSTGGALAGPNDAYARIPRSQVQTIGGVSDTVWNATDPYYGFNTLPIVARVHIDSIDGGRVYSPIFKQNTYPHTVGKMTVREVYKGAATAGTQLNYSRLGAIVSYDQYWNSLNRQQQEKILHLNDGHKPAWPKYIHEKFLDDVDIEAGKDYVVFLRPLSSQDGSFHEYVIDGFQFGLREIKGTGNDVVVLNNETGAWEALDSIVKLG